MPIIVAFFEGMCFLAWGDKYTHLIPVYSTRPRWQYLCYIYHFQNESTCPTHGEPKDHLYLVPMFGRMRMLTIIWVSMNLNTSKNGGSCSIETRLLRWFNLMLNGPTHMFRSSPTASKYHDWHACVDNLHDLVDWI